MTDPPHATPRIWAASLKDIKDPEQIKQFIKVGGFAIALRLFHIAASRLDGVTDFAVHIFSKLSPEETHPVTAGIGTLFPPSHAYRLRAKATTNGRRADFGRRRRPVLDPA